MESLSLLSVPGVAVAWLAFRRAFYAICLATGAWMIAEEGRELGERETYLYGRQRVLQTVVQFIKAQWAFIEWRAMWLGLRQMVRDQRIYWSVTLRGIRRDVHLILEAIRALGRETPKNPNVALLRDAIAKEEPLVEARALVGMQAEIGALLTKGEKRTPEETLRLVHMREQMRQHADALTAEVDGSGPRVAAMPLLGPVGAITTGGLVRIAAFVTVAAALVIWAQFASIGNLKTQNKMKADLIVSLEREATVKEAQVRKLIADVREQGVRCVAQMTAAAERRAKQDERQRAAQQAARRKLNEAATQAGVDKPFDINSRLQSLAGPAGDNDGDSGGSRDVASGVLREGQAPAPASAGGQ